MRETNCFLIYNIDVTGVTLLEAWVIAPIQSRYENRCLGERSIGSLLADVNRVYAERGYITTRAYLPEQDLKTGLLKIKVVEGRIEKIVHRISTDDGKEEAAPEPKTRTAFPSVAGQPLNLRDIEQGIDNFHRMASSRAAVDLAPGTQEGGSIIVIKEKSANPIRVSAGWDNAGSLSTGRMRARVSLEADDLANLNDTWGLNLITSENTNGVTGSVSVPYGYTELSLGGSYFESQNELSRSSLLFSQTASAYAKAERLIWRDAGTKLRVNSILSHSWNQRLINAANLTPSERTSGRLGLSSELHWPGSAAQIDAGFSRGLPAPFAIEHLVGDRKVTPNVAFTKLDAFGYWIRAFEWGRVVATAQAQFTSDVLLSPDQLTLGGWDSVRGYQNVETSGDRGAFARTELILALPPLPADFGGIERLWETLRGKIEPFAFADAGRVWSIATHDSVGMIGTGAGVRFTSDRVRVEMAAGTPLLDVPGLKDNWQAYGNVSLKIY